MKVTQVLRAQHLGRMIKFNWFAAAKQTPRETHAEFRLKKMGIPVVDAVDVVNPKKEYFVDPEMFAGNITPKELPKDEKHPDYKVRPCLRVLDQELLVQGTDQAQVLTRTVLVGDTLPERIESLIIDAGDEVHNTVQRIVQTSNIFDAHQEKLPKKKDPNRPAWVFPREYGITGVQKSRNLTQKLIQYCESLCGPELAQHRQVVYDGIAQVPIVREGDFLLLNMKLDFLLTSAMPLKPIARSEDVTGRAFPNLYPLISTVGLRHDHFYELQAQYPISIGSRWSSPHTLFVYHDCENVKNFTELPIKEDQLLARSLMKSFTTAASYAVRKYGENVEDLPEPLTIQCVQSDGQKFHFSVFQLNTLKLEDNDGKVNFWWSMPQIDLFAKAQYENARPVFDGYNPEVFKRILAFYMNV